MTPPTLRLTPIRAPNPELIDLLSELLGQAQAGELQSLIYSGELKGGHIQSGYTDLEDAYTTIGQLERMKVMLLRELD